VYQNHPYSKSGPWVGAFLQYLTRLETPDTHAQLLGPSSTGTAWFDQATKNCASVAMLTKRVAFIDPATGKPTNSNQWGSCIWYYGSDPNRFVDIWQPYAAILVPQ
jgi:hypothetical protein